MLSSDKKEAVVVLRLSGVFMVIGGKLGSLMDTGPIEIRGEPKLSKTWGWLRMGHQAEVQFVSCVDGREHKLGAGVFFSSR